MPSDGCRSTIYPTINPYKISGRNMVSFGALFGVVLGHGRHDPSSVLFSFRIIPFSPTFASLFRLKLCRIFVFDCWKVCAVLICVLVDVLLVVFSIYSVFFARKKGGATKKFFSFKVAQQFGAVTPDIQQSTHM